jgi:hypothetical protein
VNAPQPPNVGFRFGLRWLFALMTAAALCALVFRMAGRDEAIGIAIACLLAAIGWRFRSYRFVKWPAFALATVLVWFSTVDLHWTIDWCRHCASRWYVAEVRLLHYPLWTWRGDDEDPFIATVCEDLGSPHPHDLDRWEMGRLWGLVLPRDFRSPSFLSVDAEWYSPAVRRRVQELGRREPQLGGELVEALRSDNRPTIRAILTRIRAEAVP